MSPHRTGVLLVSAAAVAWSSAGVLTRAIAAPAANQLFWRAAFAALALLVVIAVQSRGRLLGAFRALGLPGLAVAVCFAVASSAFMLALGRTTVARVLFIQAAAPFIAAALAWFVMRERVRLRTGVAMTAAVLGVGVMLGSSLGSGDVSGDLLAILMTTGFSAAIVLTRRYRDVLMTPATCLGMGMAALAILPWIDPLGASGNDIVLLAVFGSGQMCAGLALFAIGARLIPAGEAGLLTILEVVLGPLWVWLAYAERPDLPTFAGGAIVISAVVVHTAFDLRRPATSPRRRLDR